MHLIQNPVLRGFNPDPSFVRVRDDYYLATSTFEWFPGVQLHHSRDLVNWRLVGHALTRTSQLNLQGIADSGGVWAPSLSYADGQFWLIYTNLRTCGMGRKYKDIKIYLTTAPSIEGPWTEPIFLNSIGFDPSLFHDDDGRKWLVNMIWDHRKNRFGFAGIVLQEYDHKTGKLVGPMTKLMQKVTLCEGPNLYKKDGWYYLLLAEGGTGWNHGISMARSRNITGPYELDPREAVLTTRDDESQPLQKAGHGELVQTKSGEWYLAHLASRPLGTGKDRRCMLGRETCLQKVVWSEDGWLRLAQGGHHPAVQVPAPEDLTPRPLHGRPCIDHFDTTHLSPRWAALRRAITSDWADLVTRPGWLRLRGGESPYSLFEQSLVAWRLEATRCRVRTRLDFRPTHYTQMAGLIAYYDTRTHYYLRVTADDAGRRVLGIVLCDDTLYDEIDQAQIDIHEWKDLHLEALFCDGVLQFSASEDGQSWIKIGPGLDATKLSDDYGNFLHFTGCFAGLCAQDLGGTGKTADFDFLEMSEIQ